MRSFPFTPRAATQLEIGDFWTVALPSGGLGVLQVRDLEPRGRKSLVAGVVDWCGDAPPQAADLRGQRVLRQGLTRIETFTEGGAEIIGNTSEMVPVDGLTSTFRPGKVGEVTHVWGWKTLPRVVERVLHEGR